MKVACEHCGAIYEVQEEKVPAQGMTMKCPKCLSSFKVMPPVDDPTLAKGRTIMGLGVSADGGVVLPAGEQQQASPAASPKGSGTLLGAPAGRTTPKASGGGSVPTIGSGPDVSLFIKRYTGRVFGPFPVETIRGMLDDGKLDGTEDVSEDRESWIAIAKHPAFESLAKEDASSGSVVPSELDLPAPAPSIGGGLDLPSPKKGTKPPSSYPVPQAAGGRPAVPGAVSGGTTGARELDLPEPKAAGRRDLPQAKAGTTGARELDLPEPKGGGVPPPIPGEQDLPAARQQDFNASGGVELTNDLPEAMSGASGADSGTALDLSELDLVAPKGGADGASLGAESLDLGELDLVQPKTGTEGDSESQRGDEIAADAAGAGSDSTADQSAGGSGGIESQPARAGLLSRLGWKFGVGVGVGLVLVLVAVWLLFLRHPKSGGSGQAGRRPSKVSDHKPGHGVPGVPNTVAERRLDTPQAYEAALDAAYDGWKKSRKDPVLGAVAAQCALSAKIRYGIDKKVAWATKQVRAALAGGTKHPDLTKAAALAVLVAGKKGAGRKASLMLKPLCTKSHSEVWACVYRSWARWRRGRFASSLKAAKRAVKASDENAAALFAMARNEAVLGRDKAALAHLATLLAKSPAHIEAALEKERIELRNLPGSQLQSKKGLASRSRIRALYRKAKASGLPWLVGLARLTKAEFSMRLGQEDKAFSQARKAAKARPEPRTWELLAERLLAYGRSGEAMPLFDRVLSRWAFYRPAIEGKARALVALGQADGALALVRKVWEEFPQAPWIRVLRGDVNLARGKPASAEKWYKKAVALDAKYVPAYVAWLRLRVSTDPAAGLAQLEQLSAQGLSHPDLFFMKAELLAARKKWADAAAAYRRAMEREPFDNRYALGLGKALLASGKVEQGLDVLDDVWKRARGHQALARILAEHYVKAGALDRAFSLLEKAAKVRPTVPLRLALAEVALKKGGRKGVTEAIEIASALVASRPLDPRVRKVLGHAYLLARRPDDVLAQFKKGGQALENDLDVLLWSAEAYMSLAQTGRALALLHQAIKRYPKSSRVLEYRAQIAIGRGDVRAALKDLVRAVKIKPSAKAYTLQAVCYLERQRTSKALRVLGKAVRLDPEYPRAHFLLGRVYYQTSRLRKAVVSLRKALTLVEDIKPDWLANAYYMLGSAYAELRNKPEARRFLKKYLKETKGQTSREKTREEARRKLRRLSD